MLTRLLRPSLLAALFALAAATLAGADAPLTIAVIPKGTTHEYWKSIHAGALQAQAGAERGRACRHLIWKGPLREDDRDAADRRSSRTSSAAR